MFIQLSKLIIDANLSGIHLMIRPSSDGRLSVVVSSEMGEGEVKDDKLRAALAQALSVEGSASDLDSEFMTYFNQFSASYTQANIASNAGEAISELNANSKEKQTPKKVTDAEPDTSEATAPEKTAIDPTNDDESL